MRSLSWLAIAACTGDKTTPIPTVPTVTGSTETADTAVDLPDPKILVEARFRALFAWDAALGQVVAPKFKDETGNFISVYLIDLYEKGAFTTGDDERSCQVVVDITGYLPSTYAYVEGFLFGLDIPPGDKEGFDRDCVDKGFDPSNFVDGNPWDTTWELASWRLRLGGPIAPEMEEWLEGAGAFDKTDDGAVYGPEFYAGGEWSAADLPPVFGDGVTTVETDPEDNFWYAFALTPEGVVDYETRLSNAEMTVSTTLATGFYYFDQNVYFTVEPPPPATVTP